MKGREKQVDVAGENRVKEGKHKVSTRSYMALSVPGAAENFLPSHLGRSEAGQFPEAQERQPLANRTGGNVTRHC